jgi:RNA polymerase sigma-70 factor (ECF subfamily)
MTQTPSSLLEQLRLHPDPEAWRRFVRLYTPMLYHWARDTGLRSPEAADLVQEVLLVLVQKLPEFSYDRQKSFRGWLRTVTVNKWREGRRRRTVPLQNGALADLPDPADGRTFEQAEYRRYLVDRALQIMQAEFQPATWKACWEMVVAGRPAAEIARELGMSINAVYIAKCRVVRRLRQELDGLLD